MKKCLLLLSFLLLLNNWSHAQNYQSIFGTQSTSWIIRWHNTFGPITSIISVQKDTIVNNKAYKKIISSNPNIYRGGLLREDLIAGKVWYKSLYSFMGTPNPIDTLERLALDYNLSKGDTFDISNSWYGYYGAYPDSFNIVDTVYYLNSLKYIKFKAPLNNFFYAENFTIIEGIGSNIGVLLKHYLSLMGGQYLLCSYKDGIKTSYNNRQFNGNCSITGIPEPSAKSEIMLFPNPVKDFLNLPANITFSQLTISDLSGKILLRQNNPTERLDFSTFSAGIYVVSLEQENKVQHVKIVKE